MKRFVRRVVFCVGVGVLSEGFLCWKDLCVCVCNIINIKLIENTK